MTQDPGERDLSSYPKPGTAEIGILHFPQDPAMRAIARKDFKYTASPQERTAAALERIATALEQKATGETDG